MPGCEKIPSAHDQRRAAFSRLLLRRLLGSLLCAVQRIKLPRCLCRTLQEQLLEFFRNQPASSAAQLPGECLSDALPARGRAPQKKKSNLLKTVLLRRTQQKGRQYLHHHFELLKAELSGMQ